MTEGVYRSSENAIDPAPHSLGYRILVPALFMILFLNLTVNAQRKADIGFFSGVSYYMGELNTNKPFYMPSLTLGPVVRYNFNMRHSLRAHAFYNNLRAVDEDFRYFDPNIRPEDTEFAASFVDLGLNFEFNWWPYKTAFRKTRYTPYVTAGVGYNINYAGGSVSHLNVPFGIGLKANLGKRLSGGLEHTVRKTFNDAIDGVETRNIGRDEGPAIFGNSDWYMFTGLFLTFKIFDYRDDCPAYDDNSNSTRR
jgi:hypothetical protein